MKRRKNSTIVSALDVAAYILTNRTNNNAVSAWKMHKLVYYCQAWSLVRDGQPMFSEKILASVNGILIKELCAQHIGALYVGSSTVGNVNHLSLTQVETIDYVMGIYGNKSMGELDEMSRSELPWKEARKDLKPTDKESVEVPLTSITEYYQNL
jgi:uncharacterized phage-associated protein